MRQLLLFITVLFTVNFIHAQNVGIGTTTPNPSAQLDIKSSSKGLLIPRMTSTQRKAIATPADGLMVYDSSSANYWYYQKNKWQPIGGNFNLDSSLQVGQVNPLSSYNLNSAYQTLSDTSGYLYDSGGPSGNYGNNENFSAYFSVNASSVYGIRIQVLSNSIENTYDSLYFVRYINGVIDTLLLPNGTIGTYNFAVNENSVVYIVFKSNFTNPAPGFAMRWDFITLPTSSSTAPQPNTGWHFVPEKLAVHGGTNFNNSWVLDSTGINSFSFGRNNKAKGDYSSALGYFTNALGNSSTATGYYATALGNSSTAMGVDTYASGYSSTAMGERTTASGNYSIAMGTNTQASGNTSTAMGASTIASGNYSIAMGYNTTASGYESTAIGGFTNASGDISTAMGNNTKAKSQNSLVIGKYNDTTATNRLFEIGNGTADNARSNALTVLDNGNVGINIINPNEKLQIEGNIKLGQSPWNNLSNDKVVKFGDGDLVTIGERFSDDQMHVKGVTGIVFRTGNDIERMRVSTSGNVGIGTTTPNAPLQFANTVANRKMVLYETTNNDHQYYGFGVNSAMLRYQVDATNADHAFFAGATSSSSNELFRIKGGGDLGVGTNAPSAYGHGGNNRIMEIKNSATAGANVQSHLILSGTSNSGSLGGITWASTSLTGEQRTGFIGSVFETANQTKLTFYNRNNSGALGERFVILGDGNAWLQGTLTQNSDARLKTNILPLTSSLQSIKQLNGYTYNWKDKARDSSLQIGVLAQELQKVYPQLVKEDEKGILSVNYIGLVPVLIESVKDQQKQIEELKAAIEMLKQKIK